jgi:hypothetical protein
VHVVNLTAYLLAGNARLQGRHQGGRNKHTIRDQENGSREPTLRIVQTSRARPLDPRPMIPVHSWDLQVMFERWTGLPPLWVVRVMRRSQALQLARSLLPPKVSEKPRE